MLNQFYSSVELGLWIQVLKEMQRRKEHRGGTTLKL